LEEEGAKEREKGTEKSVWVKEKKIRGEEEEERDFRWN